MQRGVVYVVYGSEREGRPVESWLDRSMQSVRTFHADLPVHVIRPDNRPDDGTDWFLLAEKARMFDLSPFDETLFLDIDTVALSDLSYGFEQAKRHGLACCICEAPWARRYTGLRGAGDLVEYNTGVLFFTRRAEPVFRRWVELANALPSDAHFVGADRQLRLSPYNDQASFAKAVDDVAFNPFVLPVNWNFRGNCSTRVGRQLGVAMA